MTKTGFTHVIHTSDGGYLAGGYSQLNIPVCNSRYPTIVKFDAYGKFVWEQYYAPGGTTPNGSVDDIIETENGYVTTLSLGYNGGTVVVWALLNKGDGTVSSYNIIGSAQLQD